MSYRPLSPWKREKTGSSRDRDYLMQVSLSFDTPFVPDPAFPCYAPVVCTEDEMDVDALPANLVTDLGQFLETDTGDLIVADKPANPP